MRDARIDLFRGLAIYMIFVDHVDGDPLAKITYRILGFSDATEIFVFISGLACGIAYSRILARHGFPALMLATAKRAGRIYFYYALSSVAMILLVSSALKYKGLQDPLGISLGHPLDEILSALLVIRPPPLSGILLLYIALTLFVVPALLVAHDRFKNLSLAASGLIWAGAQLFSESIAPLTHYVYPNPFAWQFLFAIGVTFGIKKDSRQPALHHSQLRWAVVAAWVVVVGALVYRVLSARSGFNVESIRLEPDTWSTMKDNLSPVRLIHFLSVALLVSVYFRQDSPVLRWTISKPLIKTGMHALEVFSLSVVLTTIVNIVVLTGALSLGDRLIVDSTGFALLALTAFALARRRALAPRLHTQA